MKIVIVTDNATRYAYFMIDGTLRSVRKTLDETAAYRAAFGALPNTWITDVAADLNITPQQMRFAGMSELHELVAAYLAANQPVTPPRVYAASRASIPERSAMWREMREAGADVTSTWIDEAAHGETECYAELWERIVREIAAAERLVLHVQAEDFPLKGAFIEVGIAIGLNRPVFVHMPGVEVEGITFRPVGSWLKHPLVTVVRDIRAVMFERAVSPDNIITL
jgi:hypothetical protein